VLQTHPLCERVDVVETMTFAPDQFFFKVRAVLSEAHTLQVRIYYNRGHLDYAYQLFTDVPLLRWDNAEKSIRQKSSLTWRLILITITMPKGMCSLHL